MTATTAGFRPQPRLERTPLSDPDDVRFHQLPRGAWRVLDARLPVDDVRALLGFVEPIRDQLALTLLDDPRRIHPCNDTGGVRTVILGASQRTARAEEQQRRQHEHRVLPPSKMTRRKGKHSENQKG